MYSKLIACTLYRGKRAWELGERSCAERSALSVVPPETPSDCHELFLRGETTSGVYTVQPAGSQPFKVFCQMTAGTSRSGLPTMGVSEPPRHVSPAPWFPSFLPSRWWVDRGPEAPGRLTGL